MPLLYLDVVFNRPLEGSLSYSVDLDSADATASADGLASAATPADAPASATTSSNGPATASATVSADGPAAVGRRVRAFLGKRKLVGYVIGERESPPPSLPPHVQIRSIEGFVDSEPVFTREHIALAQWISRFYLCSLGEALSTMIPSGTRGKPYTLPEAEQGAEITLNAEQESAVKAINRTDNNTFYLFGITGSGKTEVYLRAAEKTLSEGRGVMYLVPEIALSQQLLAHVVQHFASPPEHPSIAVLHSGLSPAQRIWQWRRILGGEAKFVIGARSAIFAPLQNIGLIIIDEEQDTSYKSSSQPKYHARQIALHRAEEHKAKVLFGSATPSVEAWHFMHTGLFTKLELRRRIFADTLPSLSIAPIDQGKGSIGAVLQNEMRNTLESGKQVLLFLNRRGFGYFIHCRSCGASLLCPRCSLSLVYHKARARLQCHFCSYSCDLPQVCPNCGSLDLHYAGFGTEKIEEEVAQLFPSYSIDRIDSDSASKAGELEKRMRAFREGATDILLGTQMITKGFNFPKLALVGIILAESSLLLPDFRSYERTFSLLTQVAGRSGRFESGGKVIIQSLNPAHHIIQLAKNQDTEGFYERELAQRRELKFPPFRRLIRILVRGRNKDRVIAHIHRISTALSLSAARSSKRHSHSQPQPQKAEPSFEILGPSECSIAVLNKNYRAHCIVLAQRLAPIQSILSDLLRSIKTPAGLHVEIDVDPQSML